MTLNGDPLKVDYNNNDNVATLKEKVKGKKEISPPANKLTVWQFKKPKFLVDANVNKILHKVDFSDCRKTVQLASVKMMMSLKLSKNEILLV